jgi:hypothetical protein
MGPVLRSTLAGISCGWALLSSCGSGSGNPTSVPPPPRPPVLAGRLYAYQQWDSTPPASPTYGPADTVRLRTEVHSQARLRWVGLAFAGLGSFRDSAAVPASVDTAVALLWTLTIRPGTRGLFRVTAFARDSADGYGDVVLDGNPLSIYDTVTYPVTSAFFDANCSVIIPFYAAPFAGCDLAIDSKRDVVYFSEPDSSRIAVLSLATMTHGPAIPAPGTVSGLDVTPSGDSLVVALPTLGQLGIVDLTTPSPTWHVVDLTVDTLPGRKPAGVRVAASGRVLVSLTTQNVYQSPPPPPDSTQIIEYDLGTGTQRARGDVGPGSGLSLFRPLVRSPDASRILLSWQSIAYQDYQMYQTERDTLLPRGSLTITGDNYSGQIPAISLSANGRRSLIKGFLFDETRGQVAYLDPPGEAWVSALSLGGDTAYFGFGAGVLRTRLANGATFERVLLPEAPTRLDVLPGGTRLLALGSPLSPGWTARVYLVHLRRPPVAAAARAGAVFGPAGGVRSSVRFEAASPR